MLALHNGVSLAHDPVFGIGPHVLFKDGFELAIEVAQEKTGEEKETELGLEIIYGITGDWAAGIEVPYAIKDAGALRISPPVSLMATKVSRGIAGPVRAM